MSISQERANDLVFEFMDRYNSTMMSKKLIQDELILPRYLVSNSLTYLRKTGKVDLVRRGHNVYWQVKR